MVEIFTLLTTIISTIIVIIMASIFFCCWTKKSSGGLNERKLKSNKAESTKNNSEPTPSSVEKSKNGVVAETQSASQCEMTLPLLSPSALDDSSDDLGDFSAVQRETEILRPYRKPPPHKRARQSKAPKVLKVGKSQDIFQELYEDDSNQSSDKENTDSTDDVDSVLLRQDKDKTTRDVRSSMLAEIEQTLAVLHMAEQPTTPTSTVSSNGPDNASSIHQQSLFSENKADHTSAAEKESPKIFPIAKPRTGPKVSPKPSPKVRSKLRYHDDITISSEKPSETMKSISLVSNCEPQLDGTSTALTVLAANATQHSDTPAELTDERSHGTISAAMDATFNTETTTNADQTVDQSRCVSPPGAAHTNLVFTKEKKYEGNTRSSSTSSSSQLSTSSDTAKSVTDISHDKDNVIEHNKSINVKNRDDAHSDNQEDRDSQIHISNGEESESSINNKIIKKDQDKSSTKNITDEAAAQQASPDEETLTSQYGATRKSRSEQTGNQRRESTEDQTGKGKTSKIPVRAGSKPRSSSPKMLSGEKVSSATN